MIIKYSDIKTDLREKSRREQYMLLLQTAEWADFRQQILDLHSRVCENCQTPEEKAIELSEEERAFHKSKYERDLAEFNWRKGNFSAGQWIDSIMDGTYVGPPAEIVGDGSIHTVLQIHHKLYFQAKLPWEYTKNHLQILCRNCHAEVHRTTRIYIYQDEEKRYWQEILMCQKCSGTGYLPHYHYWDQGISYDCGGLGGLI